MDHPTPSLRWRLLRPVVTLAVVAGLTLPTQAARAQDGFAELGLVIAGILLADIAIGAGGIVPIVGDAVAVGQGYRPGPGWEISSYVLGSINAVVGILWTAVAIDASLGSGDPDLFAALGTIHLAIGGTAIGLAAYGSTLPERGPPDDLEGLRAWFEPDAPKIGLAPMVAPTRSADGDTGLAFGASFQLIGF